ncbi:MAG: hypothetical protein JKY33_03040 [Bacteroidia bacterium]|nr:hypothetical protein [Bacteroidia bacterium]
MGDIISILYNVKSKKVVLKLIFCGTFLCSFCTYTSYGQVKSDKNLTNKEVKKMQNIQEQVDANEESEYAAQRNNTMNYNTIKREIEIIDEKLSTVNNSLENTANMNANEIEELKQKKLTLQQNKKQLDQNLEKLPINNNQNHPKTKESQVRPIPVNQNKN